MDLEKGFLGGFLVLGFGLFIVGFLTGMLALAVLNVTPDFATLGFLIFAVGFIVGMLTIALTLVVVKLTRASRNVADHDRS
ncbi:MAG: hypothetical protein ABSD73_08835 [Candidatus Bathyarchaeia archaeon]|jgi:hypothetical protein